MVEPCLHRSFESLKQGSCTYRIWHRLGMQQGGKKLKQEGGISRWNTTNELEDLKLGESKALGRNSRTSSNALAQGKRSRRTATTGEPRLALKRLPPKLPPSRKGSETSLAKTVFSGGGWTGDSDGRQCNGRIGIRFWLQLKLSRRPGSRTLVHWQRLLDNGRR